MKQALSIHITNKRVFVFFRNSPASLHYIPWERDLNNYAIYHDFEMSCSFYSENSPCGPEPGKDNITIIPVKACDKDLSNHLFGLGVSGSTRPELCSEAEILFNRGGFISPTEKQVEEFTVCPKHRYSLTYGWAGRKRLTCCHPNHSGKRNQLKNPRRINIEMSRSIFILENEIVPMGAGKR